MARIPRLINPAETTVYHVISRTALDGLPFGDVEKDELVKIIKYFSRIYSVELLGYTVLDNHFHILVRMIPGDRYSDEEIARRYRDSYGDMVVVTKELIDHHRSKWSSLSWYVKEIKQTFSRYYNNLKDRRGTLWGERFKSVIVENGETLVNCLAYIDLNAVRAGILDQPELYRWCSLGYHCQTGNKDGSLSLDFGLVEFGVTDEVERLKRYRRYVYKAAGSTKKSEGKRCAIKRNLVEREQKKEFELTRADRFIYRTRYFTDSGVIGSKAFVSAQYSRFKNHFNARHEKKPKPIKGLEGLYSLKRLIEV